MTLPAIIETVHVVETVDNSAKIAGLRKVLKRMKGERSRRYDDEAAA